MAKLFFNKKIFSNAFIVGGKRAPFEHIGDNQGVLVLDDADPNNKEMIDGLTDAAKQGRGGVLKITEQEYGDLKKKLPWDRSRSESQKRNQLLGVTPPLQKPRPKPVVADPAVPVRNNPPAPPFEKGGPDGPRNSEGLLLTGPTRAEFIEAGRDLKDYPPQGYAERDTPAKNDPLVKKYRPQTRRLQTPE